MQYFAIVFKIHCTIYNINETGLLSTGSGCEYWGIVLSDQLPQSFLSRVRDFNDCVKGSSTLILNNAHLTISQVNFHDLRI
jgi:hypothetical protein